MLWIFSVCVCMFYIYSAELWILYFSISHNFRPKITLYTRHKSPYTDFSHHWDDCDLICHPRECVVLFSVCVCVGDVCLLSFQSAWGLWLCYFKGQAIEKKEKDSNFSHLNIVRPFWASSIYLDTNFLRVSVLKPKWGHRENNDW